MDIVKSTYLSKKSLISIAGGGGKSSLLYTLLKLLTNKYNYITLATTTVKMQLDDNTKNFDFFSYNISAKEIFEAVKNNNYKKSFLLFSLLDKNTNKLIGYTPKTLDDIYRKKIFDFIINEADGGRNLPIKAPNENEPIHPESTTDVFGVIGLSSLNKIIDEKSVHRIDIFNKVTNTKIGESLTKEVMLKLILSNEGLFKNTPPNSKKHLILNQADSIKRNEIRNIFNYFSKNLININSITVTSLKNSNEVILTKSF